MQVVPDLSLSRSYTSRAARPGEADGVDYNFITRERFEAMIAADAFLEWADVFGNLYGTAAADTRANADSRPGPGARDRRAGRAAGARQVPRDGRHLRAAAVLRGARAAAARPQQGQRDGDAAAAGRPRATRSRRSWSTTTWS